MHSATERIAKSEAIRYAKLVSCGRSSCPHGMTKSKGMLFVPAVTWAEILVSI